MDAGPFALVAYLSRFARCHSQQLPVSLVVEYPIGLRLTNFHIRPQDAGMKIRLSLCLGLLMAAISRA